MRKDGRVLRNNVLMQLAQHSAGGRDTRFLRDEIRQMESQLEQKDKELDQMEKDRDDERKNNEKVRPDRSVSQLPAPLHLCNLRA